MGDYRLSARLRNALAPRAWLAIMFVAILCAASAAPARAQVEAKPPVMLVATPNLGDPIFEQTVILLLPGNPAPLVAGVIINQPTTIPVKTLLPDARGRIGDMVADFGGPVDINAPVLLARASSAPAGATLVAGDLYWMDSSAAVEGFIKRNPDPGTLRVYYGRAQWLPRQLRGEIQSGSWYVEPVDTSAVFSANPKTLWRKMVERAQLEETNSSSAGASALAALMR